MREMRGIRGSTRVLAVLGDPVSHSLSPPMFNAAVTALGLDAAYVAVRATPVALPHVLRGFVAVGICGNITIPHKVAAGGLIVRLSNRAAELGAVNTFWSDDGRLHGDNTDVDGVFAAADAVAATSPWLVFGTGGSARAVAVAARELGVPIHVHSRHVARAAEFVAWAGGIDVDARVDEGAAAGTIVNTTPLGLTEEDPLPVPPERVAHTDAVIDMVYRPGETALCRLARGQQRRTTDGRIALVGQGAAAFRRFFPGSEPPIDIMAAAVASALKP